MTSTLTASRLGGRGRGPHGPRARPRVRSITRTLPLLPALVLLVVFLVGPIVSSFYGSLTNGSLTGPAAAQSSFVGLKNYTDLFKSPDFPVSVLLTLVFVLLSAVVGQNAVGMILALLLRNGNRIVGTIVSTIVVGAWVLPEIVAAFASYAFFSTHGTLNGLLRVVGVTGPNWLYTFPMFAVIAANAWRGTAFSMLMYSAALKDVPSEIMDAAAIDGASVPKRFLYVTLPMIRRTISTNMLLTTLWTLSVFTLIYVMTLGGPGNKSMTLPVLAYQEAFKFSKLGYGTAIATVLLLVGGVFAVVYIRLLKPEVD